MNIQGLPSMTHNMALAPGSFTAPSGVNASGSSSSSTPGAASGSNSAENTFIQLLVTELQSQDPTSPMDPTTMVGQMFSMNQLQQLIDINQTLSNALGGIPAAAASSSAQSTSSNQALSSNISSSIMQAAASPASAAALYAQHLLKGAN